MGCPRVKSKATERHNRVRDVLIQFLRTGLGYTVQKEKGYTFPLPTTTPTPTDPATKSLRPDLEFDLLVNSTITRTMIDVSITNPSCPSYVKNACKTDGYCARATHQSKVRKYAPLLAHLNAASHVPCNRYEAIPFVMETYGRFDVATLSFLSTLAERLKSVNTFSCVQDQATKLSPPPPTNPCSFLCSGNVQLLYGKVCRGFQSFQRCSIRKNHNPPVLRISLLIVFKYLLFYI